MFTRRLLLALVAVALLPLAGCACRRSCNSSTNSFAPPPGPCCDKGLPPGLVPSTLP